MNRPLSEAVLALVRISAAVGDGDDEALEAALARAGERADPAAVEEILLQSYLFVGYPRALDAFARWRRMRDGAGPAASADDWAGWRIRGEDVCRRVYGDQFEALRENIRRLHPDMERWMLTEGYGKVLGRPGVDLRTRELCVAALLAALDAPTQLYSHLRGALNVGADPAEVEAVLRVVREQLDEERWSRTTEVWRRVRGRRREEEGDVR